MILQLPSIGSREVDQFLLAFHGVSEGEREGYLLRLRNITRMGFPPGIVGGGKGHPVRYTAEQFFMLIAVTQLYRCHVPPKIAVQWVTLSWSEMKLSILAVWKRRNAAEHGNVMAELKEFWSVPAEGGQRAIRTEVAKKEKPTERIAVICRTDIDKLIDRSDRLNQCHIFIDVSKLIDATFDHLKFGERPLSPEKIAFFMAGMEETRN